VSTWVRLGSLGASPACSLFQLFSGGTDTTLDAGASGRASSTACDGQACVVDGFFRVLYKLQPTTHSSSWNIHGGKETDTISVASGLSNLPGEFAFTTGEEGSSKRVVQLCLSIGKASYTDTDTDCAPTPFAVSSAVPAPLSTVDPMTGAVLHSSLPASPFSASAAPSEEEDKNKEFVQQVPPSSSSSSSSLPPTPQPSARRHRHRHDHNHSAGLGSVLVSDDPSQEEASSQKALEARHWKLAMSHLLYMADSNSLDYEHVNHHATTNNGAPTSTGDKGEGPDLEGMADHNDDERPVERAISAIADAITRISIPDFIIEVLVGWVMVAFVHISMCDKSWHRNE
jgi:hypothetical protein